MQNATMDDLLCAVTPLYTLLGLTLGSLKANGLINDAQYEAFIAFSREPLEQWAGTLIGVSTEANLQLLLDFAAGTPVLLRSYPAKPE